VRQDEDGPQRPAPVAEDELQEVTQFFDPARVSSTIHFRP
jgi:hypothetical protein